MCADNKVREMRLHRIRFGESAAESNRRNQRPQGTFRRLLVPLAIMGLVCSGCTEAFALILTAKPHVHRAYGLNALYILAGLTLLAGILKLRDMHINNLINRRTADLQREIALRKQVEEALRQARDEAVRARNELHFQATHDGLTGALNRRTILEFLGQRAERAKRNDGSIGLLLVDSDDFKTINDTLGHCAGDAVLQEITRRISQAVRPDDFVGRYGGEEFLVVLSDCDHTDVFRAAERIRLAIADTPITGSAFEIAATVSIGAAGFSPAVTSITEIIADIDAALYHAKRNGKNCTVVSACTRCIGQQPGKLTIAPCACPEAQAVVPAGPGLFPALVRPSATSAR
jgi:diguanylate cyclase (GGDEF)-like protein